MNRRGVTIGNLHTGRECLAVAIQKKMREKRCMQSSLRVDNKIPNEGHALQSLKRPLIHFLREARKADRASPDWLIFLPAIQVGWLHVPSYPKVMSFDKEKKTGFDCCRL